MQRSEPSPSADRGVRNELHASGHPLRVTDTNGAHDYFGEPFVPRRPFLGGHSQTIAGNFLPRRNELPPAEARLFEVEPEMKVLCQCHWQAERAAATTLIIVHGLEGSSESQYVIGTGSKAWSAGMNVVRMNMRNCGGTETLGPTLYNSSMSGDVGTVAETLIREDGLPAYCAGRVFHGRQPRAEETWRVGLACSIAGSSRCRRLTRDGLGRFG